MLCKRYQSTTMSEKSAIAQLKQQRHLLQLEYQEQKENYRRQTESIGLARKVTRGDAWFPLLIGRTHYNSVNQYCIEVTRRGDEEVDHNFEYGKPVVFFSAEAPGTISSRQPASVTSISPGPSRLWTATVWLSPSLRGMLWNCRMPK